MFLRDDRMRELERQYRELRRESDAYQSKRTAYMMARLQAGRHPDTDPTFWEDYKDPGPPSLELPFPERIWNALHDPQTFIVVVATTGVALVILVYVVQIIRRRIAASPAS